MNTRTRRSRPLPPRRSAARELRALLAGAPPPPPLNGWGPPERARGCAGASPEGPTHGPADQDPDSWEGCGWYDSSWSLCCGLQVRECAAEEWVAARAAA